MNGLQHQLLSQHSRSKPQVGSLHQETKVKRSIETAKSPVRPVAAPNSLAKNTDPLDSPLARLGLSRRDARHQASQKTLPSSDNGERLTSSLMRKYKSIEKIKAAIVSHRDAISDGQKKVSVSQFLNKQFHVPQRNQKMTQQRELAMFESNSSAVALKLI